MALTKKDSETIKNIISETVPDIVRETVPEVVRETVPAIVKEIVTAAIQENNKYYQALLKQELKMTKEEIIDEISEALDRGVLNVQDNHEKRLDDHEARLTTLENSL